MLTNLGVTEQQFLLAARRGMHSKSNKKYFEQLIACNNFEYFKNMMVKKNLQLEEQAYNMLHENLVKITKSNLQTIINNDKDYLKHQEIKQVVDVKANEIMNKVVTEEEKKLVELKEFEHIKNSFDLNKKDLLKNDDPAPTNDSEISLFNNNLSKIL
jgi:hypothetical protein